MGGNTSKPANASTGVYDFKNNESYEKNYQRTGYITAHQKIIMENKLNPDNCRGYSVKANGELGFNSKTLNPGGYSNKYKNNIIHNRCMFIDQRDFNPNNGLS